ncbi:putative RDD family membrane protein YckC [Microbacterium ginsengiterrae]|uniref:Putative RDD family membrane protein YckC n=1 Tax=Microbacterium ginsengiterrae TaxID=546115 RepID=A0A7W9CCI2_9MICO|nr:RDD family protein [Microbacterium ginsengiterrae]MBB5743078.1 putative RDD family membrane protein YckC [Microbacterium ginsengiterrae]
MTQPSFGAVAPTSRRAVAYLIDALIAAGIGIVLAILLVVIAFSAGTESLLGVIGIGAPLVWLVMLGWFVFYTVLQGGNGSIGMRAQGLRLVRETDGAPLGFGKALLRNIIFGLSASIIVGYFTPLFDGSGKFQGWHDKVAGALMLDARTRGTVADAPATQAVSVPPRPSSPSTPSAGPLTGVPPIPGLAPVPSSPDFAGSSAPQTPPAQPSAPLPPGLDETVRAMDEVRPSAPESPLPPAPQTTPVSHPSAPSANEDALIAFVPGITQDTPPERRTPAPPVPPAPATPVAPAPGAAASEPPAVAPAPADEPAADLGDIEDTRISIPGHRLVFTWDDGTRVTVSRRTLFGRNPAPEDGATVVPVRDETLSLSKTHFEAAAEPSGGWIIDRHSTNGTIIVRDGHRITCPPGEQVRIRLGDAIEIGDRIVTIGGYA